MKFIFPQNYNLNSKLFGIIDYSTAILDVIWSGFIFIILNLFFNNLNIKIFLFIILVLPILILSVVGINGENIIYVTKYMLKFIFRQKVLLYEKNSYNSQPHNKKLQ